VPYILKLNKVIKYVGPVAGATAGVIAAGSGGGVIGVEAAKKLAAQIKLMEELAPDRKASERTFPCCKPRK
jgi:hypothetical protein